MSVTVSVPTVLRPKLAGRKTVQVNQAAANRILEDLGKDYAGFLEAVLLPDGDSQPHVNIYVGDERLRTSEELQTMVPDGATMTILMAVAGGAGTALSSGYST